MFERSKDMNIQTTQTTWRAMLLSAMVFFLFTAHAGAGGAPEAIEIIDLEWKWQQTLYNNDTKTIPNDPDRYTITFEPGGKFNIRADCNRGGGSFSVEGNRIAIEEPYTTRAMCPPDSLEKEFIKNLNAARIYFLHEGDLYLDLKYDTGTMKFAH
jgi:heat shock protein HslJ